MTGLLSGVGSSAAGSASSWYKSDCTHEGLAQPVLKVGKEGELWAGSSKELLDCSGWDLIVSAVVFSGFVKNPVCGSDSARSKLSAEIFAWEPPPCIGLDWPDRGIPNVGRGWWKALAAEI